MYAPPAGQERLGLSNVPVQNREMGIRLAASTLAVLLVGVSNSQAQQPPTSGTLTLVFANRNGFVIASDSRRSSLKQRFVCEDPHALAFFCDDSQKVFKTGPRSALAISGFASGGAFGNPLGLQVASVLRRRYQYVDNPAAKPPEWTPPKGAHPAITIGSFYFGAYKSRDAKPPPFDEDHELEQALTAVAAFAAPTDPPHLLNFTTLIADFDKQSAPRIQRIDYVNNAHRAGPLDVMLPDYDPEDVTSECCRLVAESQGKANVVPFRYCFAGVADTAKGIIDGNYPSEDSAIRRYYRRLRHKTLHKMALSEMKSLAHSILVETNRRALGNASDGQLRQTISVVGGRDQIGVFPTKGLSQCCGQNNLPNAEQLLPVKFVRAGFLYDGRSDAVPVNPIGISFYWSGHHDPDEPIGQVFMGDYFRNVTVRLDGNYFVNNRFDSVTFRYSGGECFLPPPPLNEGRNCKLALPIGTIIRPGCAAASSCEQLPQSGPQSDGPDVVGAPIRVESTRCRRMNPDGTITFYVGGECGNTAGMTGPVIK
jgi:hypothetical protein